jgi:hypothetical protein
MQAAAQCAKNVLLSCRCDQDPQHSMTHGVTSFLVHMLLQLRALLQRQAKRMHIMQFSTPWLHIQWLVHCIVLRVQSTYTHKQLQPS